MKKKTLVFTSLLLSLAIMVSSQATKANHPRESANLAEAELEVEQNIPSASQDDGHNSRNSLDWYGVYQGVIPCADCEGIETKIILLKSNKFTRKVKYLGKEDNHFSDQGTVTWNDAGSIITLESEQGESQMYQVGENVLFHLDQEGNRITGDLADKYELTKNLMDSRIENKKWMLTELMGRPFEVSEGTPEAFILLNSESGNASGNNSCNIFNASYELKEGDRISFGKAISTRMACPDMKTSQAFMEILEKVDNYTINDGSLSLNKAKMAPLARFKVVED
jgi:heat shock protein HslJ